MFIKVIGFAGMILILCGYYMLWVSPDTSLYEVITRTRIAIALNMCGLIAVMYYLYRR